MNLYVIKDKVAEKNGPVFQAENDGVAIRSYSKLIKETEFKDDYSLVCIASYDSDTLMVKPDVREVHVETVMDIKAIRNAFTPKEVK